MKPSFLSAIVNLAIARQARSLRFEMDKSTMLPEAHPSLPISQGIRELCLKENSRCICFSHLFQALIVF